MRKPTIAVAASLAIGTATMAIGTMAFAHGGGGGHFGGAGGHFAGGHFGRGFRGGFGGPYRFDGEGLYYGYGNSSCYVVTPSGYVWACF